MQDIDSNRKQGPQDEGDNTAAGYLSIYCTAINGPQERHFFYCLFWRRCFAKIKTYRNSVERGAADYQLQNFEAFSERRARNDVKCFSRSYQEAALHPCVIKTFKLK